MKIVVLLKEVPDTYGDRKLDLDSGIADRAASDALTDEVDERALELAITYADSHSDTEVVVVTMAPASAAVSMRKALAIGGTSVVHVADDRLAGADTGLTAEVLSAAVARAGYDLIIAGNVSTDGYGGVVPAMMAERLGIPQATNLEAVQIYPDHVEGKRATETGLYTVSAPLPALISVTEKLPEVRFAGFKGIMAAKKKPYESLSLDDLGVVVDDETAARSIVVAVAERPARTAGVIVVDEGTAGEQLADFLIQNRLV
ncbi:MAG: electron transfer flavoprotein subunit beta [Subtercola sp.]|nr:electron transfer flavoprotein subunit beta [Subtercola sp.]